MSHRRHRHRRLAQLTSWCDLEKKIKKAEVFLTYQNLIDGPPFAPQQLFQQAASSDGTTVNSWATTWIEQAKQNKERFGSFKGNDLGQLWGKHQYAPIIVAGSGPSLKGNAAKLRDRGAIPLISCLHNFHYLEDLGVKADYYVSLDAGHVTIEEVYEGGTKSQDEYWALTKEHTLLCHISTHPELLKKWQGKIYFFNCPIPDPAVAKQLHEVEPFHQYVSSGGNVLGACLYIAKGYLGASDIIFVGADFCFSYDHKFHAWDSKYDKSLGQCVQMTDIYGIKRLTWQSYANFKAWFDYVATTCPGHYINASEGGCLGAYPGGNMKQFEYMDLDDAFNMYNMNRHVRKQAEDPFGAEKIILF